MNTTGNKRFPTMLTEWFPLLPRPRPACRALPPRVEEIRQLAHRAEHSTDNESRLVAATTAHNKAALILSDLGLTERARQLCWRQFDLFLTSTPLSPKAAEYALQPLVNLGRLRIRDGQPIQGYQIFTDTFQALHMLRTTTIDGRDLDLNVLTGGQTTTRRELLTFLWTVLLADGTRALIRAGRWEEALSHIKRHKGIGDRLLDGRQVAILTHALTGDFDQALHQLNHSRTPEPWEQAVAAYLKTLCLSVAARDPQPVEKDMVSRYFDLTTAPPPFRCRLGLAVIDLAEKAHHAPLAVEITKQALASNDAYTARDVLSHSSSLPGMTEADRRALAGLVSSSGLGHGSNVPADCLDELMTSVETSETSHIRSLQTRTTAEKST